MYPTIPTQRCKHPERENENEDEDEDNVKAAFDLAVQWHHIGLMVNDGGIPRGMANGEWTCFTV